MDDQPTGSGILRSGRDQKEASGVYTVNNRGVLCCENGLTDWLAGRGIPGEGGATCTVALERHMFASAVTRPTRLHGIWLAGWNGT